ncbi:MAG: ZIP family metal transporter [Desulfurococcales archaeon]|nr:ZIP family metal transporter [Desulfurococcales archaeon]
MLVKALASWLEEVSHGDPIYTALVASLFAALMTSLGSMLILFIRNPSRVERSSVLLDIGMAFSSGVMTVASFTSLLLPAIDMAGIITPLTGFILGAVAIYILNSILPHEHLIKGYEGPQWGMRKVMSAWLVAVAIIIHNIPEGMAIGASSTYDPGEGIVVGIAIGLQDLPEGLSVSLPIAVATGRKGLALLVGVLSGLSEVLTGFITALLGSAAVSLLPLLLGFGAGAMMYVVSHEALPESHRTGHENKATIGFFLGFIVMLYLDSTLG